VNESILAAVEGLPQRAYPAGADIIVEGMPQLSLYVLAAGAVEVSRDAVPVSVIDEPGAIFGELAILLRSPATATVRAQTPSTFWVPESPMEFLETRPAVALAVATTLARRLDAVTGYLVDLRNQYAGREDHLGVVDVVLESLSHHQGPPADPGSDRETEAPY
jgi:CRP/FNR family transcriptional regulator, cyclic AMP receptor protein